jgi:hypothetical protein
LLGNSLPSSQFSAWQIGALLDAGRLLFCLIAFRRKASVTTLVGSTTRPARILEPI